VVDDEHVERPERLMRGSDHALRRVGFREVRLDRRREALVGGPTAVLRRAASSLA
jgi:hypothetical protein